MKEAPSLETIIQAVAEALDVTEAEIVSHRREGRLAHARHVAWWLARSMTRLTFSAIGTAFERDHSSVMHGVHRIGERMDREPHFAASVRGLAQTIYSRAEEGDGWLSRLRALAPLTDSQLLRALAALLASDAGLEALLITADHTITAAMEVATSGNIQAAAELGAIALELEAQAARRGAG